MLATVLAHGGQDGPVTLAQALRLWSFDPTVLFAVLLPGLLYWRGLRAWTKRRGQAPLEWWRPLLFYTGLVLVFIALCSPIDGLADDYFFFHMLQHQLIMMMAPPLLLLGAPTTPVLLGLPVAVRRNLVRPLVRNRAVRAAYGFITYPFTAWALFSLSIWSWHFIPGAYDAATTHGGIHFLEHLSMSWGALLFWWTIIDPKPLKARLPLPARFGFIIVNEFQVIILGIALTLRHSVLYPYYQTRGSLLGFDALGDQQAGGAFMWVMGSMMLAVAALFVLSVWFDRQEKKDRARELALDAANRMSRAHGEGPVLGR